jgi:acyl-CoA reductase-like NAD-dependent aldehyde dehydrogenase
MLELNMCRLKSVNPSTGKVVGEVEVSSESEVIEKVKRANQVLDEWRNLGVMGRVEVLKKIPELIKKNKDNLAILASKEMGMPIGESRDDIDYSLDYFNWYFDNAEKYLSPEIIYEDKEIEHIVYREPRGVVAVITPWNFPVSNFVWSAVQNLIVGNTVVFKDSEEVPLFGKEIEKLMDQVGLPEGVFAEVYGGGQIGELLTDQDIDMVCFTGSAGVGQKIYQKAAEKFIPVFLELGGSAPGIVFEDANLDQVLESIYWAKFLNCGQVCDGLKRLIVHENKFDDVVGRLKNKLENLKIGPAVDESTQLGPLVSQSQLEKLENQVEDAVGKGARVVTGGKRLKDLPGWFYLPTLLTEVTSEMRVWQEEVFGPVLPIVSFQTEEEAVELANNTKYGLGSYLYSEDKKLLKRTAEKLETGMVSINNANYLQPCSPFGGRKKSGMGWQHGRFGFHQLSQMKLTAYEKI